MRLVPQLYHIIEIKEKSPDLGSCASRNVRMASAQKLSVSGFYGSARDYRPAGRGKSRLTQQRGSDDTSGDRRMIDITQKPVFRIPEHGVPPRKRLEKNSLLASYNNVENIMLLWIFGQIG
jgi:hypothetical protein